MFLGSPNVKMTGMKTVYVKAITPIARSVKLLNLCSLKILSILQSKPKLLLTLKSQRRPIVPHHIPLVSVQVTQLFTLLAWNNTIPVL